MVLLCIINDILDANISGVYMLELAQLENGYDVNKQELNLEYQELTDADIPTICAFLKKNPDITNLNLSHNNLTDKGTQLFINQTSISKLNLSHNDIGPEGARFLSEDKHLTILDVSFNHIGDDGAIYLSNNENLKVLYAHL